MKSKHISGGCSITGKISIMKGLVYFLPLFKVGLERLCWTFSQKQRYVQMLFFCRGQDSHFCGVCGICVSKRPVRAPYYVLECALQALHVTFTTCIFSIFILSFEAGAQASNCKTHLHSIYDAATPVYDLPWPRQLKQSAYWCM